MNLMKRTPKLLALSAGVLLVNGANPRVAVHARAAAHSSATDVAETTQAKIARAMSAGPADVANSARIIDTNADGKTVVLREGNNGFTFMPGNPKAAGDPPMCSDRAAMQWGADFRAHKAKPTNTEPGIIYMLAGATQRSDSDPYDMTSRPIPIGPHWMIIWPYDAKRCGLPNTVRDAGAWVMFDGTPYAYLHICGTPWVGNEYGPGQVPIWTMRYGRPLET